MCLNTGINQSWWWGGNQLPPLSQKRFYLWGDKTNLDLTQENHPSFHLVWSPQWWKPSYWQDIKVCIPSLSHHPRKELLQHHRRYLPSAQDPRHVALFKLFPARYPGAGIVLGTVQEHGAKGKMGREGKFPLLTPQLQLLQKQLAQSLAHMTCGNKVLQTWIKCSESHWSQARESL